MFKLRATIMEALPRKMYLVECEEGALVRASVCTSASHGFSSLVPGSQVWIERYTKDPTRARIVGVCS